MGGILSKIINLDEYRKRKNFAFCPWGVSVIDNERYRKAQKLLNELHKNMLNRLGMNSTIVNITEPTE